MKKLLSIILSVSILLSAVMITIAEDTVYSDSKRSVYLDGAYVDINNIVIDDVEYLPIKELCSLLGYDIKETTENTYEITEGENCKNSESTMGKAIFTISDDFFTTFSKDGQYENKTQMFPTAPMTVEIGDEIYIPAYYFGRMFEVKARFTEDMKIVLITVNNRKEQISNAPEYPGHIFVKSFDNELRVELDGKEMEFSDKPFIDSEGRTQIPVRAFCEQIGCNVIWQEDKQKVLISTVTEEESKENGGAGGDNFSFTTGKRRYTINGTEYDMDTEARIINNRIYVPLRYLAEAMNYYVAYNPTSPAKLDVGYGPSVMNSYLGLEKEFVMDEMDIDESCLLKAGDEEVLVPKHQEGSMYIVRNGYKKGHVVLEFYNGVLYAFQYVFKTEGEALDEALNIYDYLLKLHGDAATYPGVENTVSKIGAEESQFNDEVCSYYDEWHINASKKLIETLLGDSDNALMKTLKIDINPMVSAVRVNLSKDVNFHNRSSVESIYNPTFADKIKANMPTDKNYMFSPLSIKMAFAMAANGADGKTKSEILNALGIDDLNKYNEYAKKLIEGYQKADILKLDIANALWLNESHTEQKFSKSYKNTLNSYYNAEVNSSKEDVIASEINSWVKEKTNNKIDSIISDELARNESFIMALLNAVYFKATWQNEFDEKATKEDVFTDKNGNKNQTDFMNKTASYGYYNDNGVEILKLPYKNRVYDIESENMLSYDFNVSMYLLRGELDEKALSNLIDNNSLKNQRIALSMPKFESKFDTSLVNIMKEIGVADAFIPEKAEFKNMFDGGNTYLMEAMHKTYIKVDEEGTEAAAVTGLAGGATSVQLKPKIVKFDTPFTYVIRDDANGEILFMGEYAFVE